MKPRPTFTLPILVLVAVAALVLGSFGTATAAGLTKGKVKKIAAKVVRKSAPTLAVAHATTADNAATLGGKAPDAYLDRTAFAVRGAVDTTPVGGTAVSGPLSITVPTDDHFVHLTSGVQYKGAVGNIVEWWAVDSTCANLNGYNLFPVRSQIESNPVNTPQVSMTMDYVFNVTPGVHTFTVCALSDAGVTAANSSLVLETVAMNGTGGITRPADLPKTRDGVVVTTHP